MGAIHVHNLGKAYKQYPSRGARALEWLTGRKRHHLHWVLHDVSFTVHPGEAVGIVGINGAGKSTLLKMITGTTQPTTGSVQLGGRVAALLELGMGFHPEFTGRQNVYMAGQLLGYSEAEITQLMPTIEDFAEIGEYIDQPIRVYSSGMQMRLAFSVAVARRPEILIVDEALSVGDAYFQHKSFDRIRRFREEGTTLLIVSHDKQAIQSICDRAVLLDRGRVAMEGQPEAVMDMYNALLADHKERNVAQQELATGRVQTISGTGEARVVAIALITEDGAEVEVVEVGMRVTLRVTVRIFAPVERLVFGYMIKDRVGQPIYGTNTHYKERPLYQLQAGEEVSYECSFAANLGPGSYSVSTALVSTETHLVNNYEWKDLALVFTVTNVSQATFVGCAWLDPCIEVARG